MATLGQLQLCANIERDKVYTSPILFNEYFIDFFFTEKISFRYHLEKYLKTGNKEQFFISK